MTGECSPVEHTGQTIVPSEFGGIACAPDGTTP